MNMASSHLMRGRRSGSPERSRQTTARARKIWEAAMENNMMAAEAKVRPRAARDSRLGRVCIAGEFFSMADGKPRLSCTRGLSKNRVEPAIEQAVIEMAIEKPALGQVRVANELTKRGQFVSPTGVRSIWLRNDPQTCARRLKALEARQAQNAGLVLTEQQVRALEKSKQEKEAHGEIDTAHPGYLGAQDTYYVGTIKGVGRRLSTPIRRWRL